MTGRDPMFGRVHKPYAGGTGNSQDGPSQERQEREDEEGISKARQTLVLGYLEREGPLGMTIRELSKLTNWHHGQSSNALSLLNLANEIVRLVEKRGGQSVYVLESFRAGREVAKRRRSAADKAREDLSGVQLKLSVQEKESARLAEHIAASDATVGQVTQRLTRMTQRVTAVEAELVQSNEERDIYQQQLRLTHEQLERVQEQLAAMTQENSAHRIATSLRMGLEPEETELVLRQAKTLGDPRVQKLADDYQVKMTLEVLRTLMRIIKRSTRFGVEDTSQPSAASAELSASPRRSSIVDND